VRIIAIAPNPATRPVSRSRSLRFDLFQRGDIDHPVIEALAFAHDDAKMRGVDHPALVQPR
jgi:hypothetical protein